MWIPRNWSKRFSPQLINGGWLSFKRFLIASAKVPSALQRQPHEENVTVIWSRAWITMARTAAAGALAKADKRHPSPLHPHLNIQLAQSSFNWKGPERTAVTWEAVTPPSSSLCQQLCSTPDPAAPAFNPLQALCWVGHNCFLSSLRIKTCFQRAVDDRNGLDTYITTVIGRER